MTFPRQITDDQLARAKLLIETTDRDASDIAREVGTTKNTLWRYAREGGWDRRGRTRGPTRAIPDDLPYWRFRIYIKARNAGASFDNALRSAETAVKVAA